MLYVLSPAKRLDYETPAATPRITTPSFVARSAELIEVLRRQSVAEVQALMHLSQPLAELNVERYRRWRPRFTSHNSKPALLAFDGDVYEGLKARELADPALEWAQDHLAILSGLYGVLRPLDRMQPYRLEMGTALPTSAGRNLYDYWGDTLAEYLNRRAARQPVPVIVNLASQEYFRAVDRAALKPRVVECVFEEARNGGHQVIGFFAKRARGRMARYAIDHRIELPADLRGFDADGYRHAANASTPDRLVFRRTAPD
ncbi:MAG: peroxide stress protein YaaA [Burkholderiaceae bacterium]